jgi:hypothetical protein
MTTSNRILSIHTKCKCHSDRRRFDLSQKRKYIFARRGFRESTHATKNGGSSGDLAGYQIMLPYPIHSDLTCLSGAQSPVHSQNRRHHHNFKTPHGPLNGSHRKIHTLASVRNTRCLHLHLFMHNISNVAATMPLGFTLGNSQADRAIGNLVVHNSRRNLTTSSVVPDN